MGPRSILQLYFFLNYSCFKIISDSFFLSMIRLEAKYFVAPQKILSPIEFITSVFFLFFQNQYEDVSEQQYETFYSLFQATRLTIKTKHVFKNSKGRTGGSR